MPPDKKLKTKLQAGLLNCCARHLHKVLLGLVFLATVSVHLQSTATVAGTYKGPLHQFTILLFPYSRNNSLAADASCFQISQVVLKGNSTEFSFWVFILKRFNICLAFCSCTYNTSRWASELVQTCIHSHTRLNLSNLSKNSLLVNRKNHERWDANLVNLSDLICLLNLIPSKFSSLEVLSLFNNQLSLHGECKFIWFFENFAERKKIKSKNLKYQMNFYLTNRRHIKCSGVMAQWWPAARMSSHKQ